MRDSGREISDFRHYCGQPPGDWAFPLGKDVGQLPVVPEGVGFARRKTVENGRSDGRVEEVVENGPRVVELVGGRNQEGVVWAFRQVRDIFFLPFRPWCLFAVRVGYAVRACLDHGQDTFTESLTDRLNELRASVLNDVMQKAGDRLFLTFNIFSGNYLELKKACEIVENPDIGLKLMSEPMKGAGVQAHMEVMRLFHNFLASAKSLVDHTRAFVDDHYAGTAFKQGYDQKVQAELASDPLIKFIQDLRNHMLHRGLPSGSMSLIGVRAKSSNRLCPNVQNLKLAILSPDKRVAA